MSYSFTVKEGSKGAAVLAVRAELEKVVVAQPGRAKDSKQGAQAAELYP